MRALGLPVALVAGVYRHAQEGAGPNQAIYFGLFLFGVALAGGFFGCKLFPPVAREVRRVAGPLTD